jgi:hypothetical protein
MGDVLANLAANTAFGCVAGTALQGGVGVEKSTGLDSRNEAQAPTAEMAATPPSIRKSAPTTYAESSDAR